jgi:hypothetical protein
MQRKRKGLETTQGEFSQRKLFMPRQSKLATRVNRTRVATQTAGFDYSVGSAATLPNMYLNAQASANVLHL